MDIDEYITTNMSLKHLVDDEDQNYFKTIYYGTFPNMRQHELPELKVYYMYDICTRLLHFNTKPYLIFDNNMHNYIQLLTYSFFSDEARENFIQLFYSIRSDYLYSKHQKNEAEECKTIVSNYVFIMPNYTDEEKRILYNINYVSFPLQCFHEMVHYYFGGELKKRKIKSIIVDAIRVSEESFFKIYKSNSILLSDNHLKEEIYCDCEALFAILLLFSDFKREISPKDIIDSAILNLIGIIIIQEAKINDGTSYYKRTYLRLTVLTNYIKMLINNGYISSDSYEDVDSIVKFFFEDIYPVIISLKNSDVDHES